MRPASIWITVLVLLPLSAACAATSVQVHTVAVAKHRLRQTLTAFGIVRPNPTSETTRDASYKAFVTRLDVTLGQPVHKGEALLELRTAPSARAQFLSAQASVRYARQDLARKRHLLRQKLATHAEVDAAKKTLLMAQATFTAQRELGTGEKERVIKAPFSGIVSQLPIKPGNEVRAGTQLFQLAKRDSLEVALGVEPNEVGRMHIGMPVAVRPLFGSVAAVHTRVAQVNAVVDPHTRLVDVIVRLQGKQAQTFLPGMRVRGVLTLVTRRALAVPRSAVLHDSRGDYLFVVKHGTAHRVDVHKGLESHGLVAVRGALHAGERVVVQGNYELSDGMAVRAAP